MVFGEDDHDEESVVSDGYYPILLWWQGRECSTHVVLIPNDIHGIHNGCAVA